MRTISKYAISAALLLTVASGLAYAQQANDPPPPDDVAAAGPQDCDGGQGMRKHGRGHGMRGMGRMMMLDANNDGFINADEAAAVADGIFTRVDRNHDDVIDQAEGTTPPKHGGWRNWMGGNPPADVTEKLKAAFTERDADKDGKVTKAEFMIFAQSKYASLDTAKDGKVSPWAFRALPRL